MSKISMPYVRTNGNKSTVNCSADLLVLHGNLPVLISLIDINVRTKKVASDFVISSGERFGGISVELRDRENEDYSLKLNTSGVRWRYKFDRAGEFTHTIISNSEVGSYIFDWDGSSKIKKITDFLRAKHFIPVNEELVERMIGLQETKASNSYYSSSYTWVSEISVVTNNPEFENLKVYFVDVNTFLGKLGSFRLPEFSSEYDWDKIEDMEDYIFEFSNVIRNKLKENIQVLYDPNRISPFMFEGKIKPYDGQVSIIQSSIEVLRRSKSLYLGAEMGVGKTSLSVKAIHSLSKENGKTNYDVLIVAPAITLKQWQKEIIDSIDDEAEIHVIRSTVDFIRNYNPKPVKPTFYLVGKETFKLDSKLVGGVRNISRKLKVKSQEKRYSWSRFTEAVEREVLIEFAQCPNCGRALQNENRKSEDVFFKADDFVGQPRKSNYKCGNCDSVLWQQTYDKTKKTSLINYIKVKGVRFNFLIADEAHESNNSDSIIGTAIRTVFNHGDKVICLSGTSNNGYSSSLHNVLMGLMSQKMVEDGVVEKEEFVKKYGTLQATSKIVDHKRYYHRRGRSQISDSQFKEIEGVNPVCFTKFLAENYIFANLDDLGNNLPDLVEKYIPVVPDEELKIAENRFGKDLQDANSYNYKMYQDSLQRHYVNNPFGWHSIVIEKGEESEIVNPANLNPENLLQKERELIELIRKEKSENRKVWVYTDFSGESEKGQYMRGKNIPERLKGILEKEGFKVFWLRPSVSPIDRKELIEKNIESNDVFISNPKLVNVGINLTWCPTYIFYIPSYHVNVVSQASRRGYRANSTLENRIFYVYYIGTCEEEIVRRQQLKMAEARAIEGRFNVALENENIRTASRLGSEINRSLK